MSTAFDFPGITMGPDAYGKGRVRVAKIFRRHDRHDFVEYTVNIQLEGDFKTAFYNGTNEKVLPTDTMKNTVYVIMKKSPSDQPEQFAMNLADHFLRTQPQVSAVTINILQHLWTRMIVHGQQHHHSFSRAGPGERRTATCRQVRGQNPELTGGIQELCVLKTTQSGFEGYIVDANTSLAETTDRIFATNMTATWKYRIDIPPSSIDFQTSYDSAKQACIEKFAGCPAKGIYSPSVQYTIWQMGAYALQKAPALENITLSLPNLHYIPYNFPMLKMEKDIDILFPIDEPHGAITGTIVRDRKGGIYPRVSARL